MAVNELLVEPEDLVTKVFEIGLRLAGINNLKVVVDSVSAALRSW